MVTKVNSTVLNDLQPNITQVGTLSNLTVSGNILVNNLTASQAILTNASKVLISTPITGTGNVVLSTGPILRGYNEKVTTIGSIGTSTYNLDISEANIFDITLGANVTVTFTGAPPAGFSHVITLIVRQPPTSPGRLLTITGALYTDGTLPILSTGANQIDVLTFWSIDGGTSYFGTFAMANVS